VCGLTKTMTKKTDCNTAEGLVRWVLCVGSSLSRACASGVPGFVYCCCLWMMPGFVFIRTDDVL
jgi:hypothetical protein